MCLPKNEWGMVVADTQFKIIFNTEFAVLPKHPLIIEELYFILFSVKYFKNIL